jgi:dienelactone hydrolase
VWWLVFIGCGSLLDGPRPVVARFEVPSQLTGNFRDGSVELTRYGAPKVSEHAQISSVRFDLRPGFQVSAALWTPDVSSGVGIVVAHGHYGQGKSGAEAQEIAHRLAARGATVLAIDTPGVEEWDQPGRHIHFSQGAHNRAWLAASGSSALALQLDILKRGLDVLQAEGATRLGVTGASGGAVQAFYLAGLDERVETAVMVSVPRIPREAAAGGCPCDQIPGHAGPDPSLLNFVDKPILWLSDVAQERPQGLGKHAEFEVMEGPHSYTAAMQKRALSWFESQIGLPEGPWLETVAGYDLSTGSTDMLGASAIMELPVPGLDAWVAKPIRGSAFSLSCSGSGPVVLTLGNVTTSVLINGGYTACAVTIPIPPGVSYDALAFAESIGLGAVRVDALAGAVQAAADTRTVVAVWGHRSWGLVAGATGLPFVVEDPIRTIEELDHAKDPPWVHVPGAWSGAIDTLLSGALANSDDPQTLLKAISASQN